MLDQNDSSSDGSFEYHSTSKGRKLNSKKDKENSSNKASSTSGTPTSTSPLSLSPTLQFGLSEPPTPPKKRDLRVSIPKAAMGRLAGMPSIASAGRAFVTMPSVLTSSLTPSASGATSSTLSSSASKPITPTTVPSSASATVKSQKHQVVQSCPEQSDSASLSRHLEKKRFSQSVPSLMTDSTSSDNWKRVRSPSLKLKLRHSTNYLQGARVSPVLTMPRLRSTRHHTAFEADQQPSIDETKEEPSPLPRISSPREKKSALESKVSPTERRDSKELQDAIERVLEQNEAHESMGETVEESTKALESFPQFQYPESASTSNNATYISSSTSISNSASYSSTSTFYSSGSSTPTFSWKRVVPSSSSSGKPTGVLESQQSSDSSLSTGSPQSCSMSSPVSMDSPLAQHYRTVPAAVPTTQGDLVEPGLFPFTLSIVGL